MRVALLLATLLVASVASAGPLDRLVDPTLLPSTREAIVAEACAPATVVTADDLRSLFPRCERPEQIALARVARHRDYVHPTRLGHALLGPAIAPAAIDALAER